VVLGLWGVETVVAERWWLTTLLTYLPQQPVLLPGLVLLPWTLARRAWVAAGLVATAMLVALFALLGCNVPRGDIFRGYPLRVVTFNTAQNAYNVAKALQAVRAAQPDVVVLQETNSRRAPGTVQPCFMRAFPGFATAPAGEVLVLSRLPILAQRSHPVPQSSRVVLEVVIDVHGHRVTIFDTHLSTATNSHEESRKLRFPHPVYLRRTAAMRSAQVDQLLALARACPTPLLIAGDFNTPPRGRIYRRLAGELRDVYRAAGWGCGETFPARLPLLRIDYGFTRNLIPVRARVLNLRGSDHRPLLMDLIVGEDSLID
jgi:vancomycin resistance protein VanJ